MVSRRIIYWIVSRLLIMMATRLWNILWLFHLHSNCLELRKIIRVSPSEVFAQCLKEMFYDSISQISKEGGRCQSWKRCEIGIMQVNCYEERELTERNRSLLSYVTNKWKLLKRKAEEILFSISGIWTLIHDNNNADILPVLSSWTSPPLGVLVWQLGDLFVPIKWWIYSGTCTLTVLIVKVPL